MLSSGHRAEGLSWAASCSAMTTPGSLRVMSSSAPAWGVAAAITFARVLGSRGVLRKAQSRAQLAGSGAKPAMACDAGVGRGEGGGAGLVWALALAGGFVGAKGAAGASACGAGVGFGWVLACFLRGRLVASAVGVALAAVVSWVAADALAAGAFFSGVALAAGAFFAGVALAAGAFLSGAASAGVALAADAFFADSRFAGVPLVGEALAEVAFEGGVALGFVDVT